MGGLLATPLQTMDVVRRLDPWYCEPDDAWNEVQVKWGKYRTHPDDKGYVAKHSMVRLGKNCTLSLFTIDTTGNRVPENSTALESRVYTWTYYDENHMNGTGIVGCVYSRERRVATDFYN